MSLASTTRYYMTVCLSYELHNKVRDDCFKETLIVSIRWDCLLRGDGFLQPTSGIISDLLYRTGTPLIRFQRNSSAALQTTSLITLQMTP